MDEAACSGVTECTCIDKMCWWVTKCVWVPLPHAPLPFSTIAQLDADSEKKVASENEIKGYPTIFWFEKGTKIEYPGNRRRADIVRWIKKRTGPPTSDLADVAALDANKPENDAMLVAVLDSLEGAEFEAFQEAAKKHEDVTMLTTTSAEVAEALGVAKAKRPVYVVRRAFGESAPEDVSSEGHAAFEGKSLDEQLVSLLKAERLPAYIEFSTETSAAIFGSGVDRQLIVAAGSEALAPGSDLDKLLREASPKLRGRFVVVTARLGADQAKAVVEFFGLAEDPEAAPQVVGFHATETGKYRFPFDELTLDNLLAFAKQVEDGSAPRLLKSAAEPAAHTEEGLTTVVGSTFEKLVLDSEKDVLLEVHAPWCGHCKKLEPIYKKLAKRFETVDSITIAQMDGTGNEHPAAEFRSFPTLLWYPAGKDQKAVPYSGERTVSAFVKFLKKNASKDFKLPKKSKKGKAKKEADADAEGEPTGGRPGPWEDASRARLLRPARLFFPALFFHPALLSSRRPRRALSWRTRPRRMAGGAFSRFVCCDETDAKGRRRDLHAPHPKQQCASLLPLLVRHHDMLAPQPSSTGFSNACARRDCCRS